MMGTWTGAIAAGVGEVGGRTHAGGGRVPPAGSRQLATHLGPVQLVLAEVAMRPVEALVRGGGRGARSEGEVWV